MEYDVAVTHRSKRIRRNCGAAETPLRNEAREEVVILICATMECSQKVGVAENNLKYLEMFVAVKLENKQTKTYPGSMGDRCLRAEQNTRVK